mgnify:CR=1 FL=1
MSYEIVYDRRFICTPLGITPLILAGSNNCYEPMPSGRERRERNWSVLFNFPVATEDELMNAVQGCCGGEFQEHFKWHGKFVNDAGFVAFIRNGIANAVALEELEEYAHCGSLRCALSIWSRDSYDSNRKELGRSVCTTEELVNWITEARQRVANRSEREEIYYSISFSRREPIHFPAHKAITGPVIAKRGNAYVSNCSPGRLETSGDISKARVFTDMNEAIDMLSPYFVKGTRFMKAENAKARKSWRFCIRVQGGSRDGMFMERLTRSRFYMTYHQNDARRFPDSKTAERFIEKRLKGRFSMPDYTVFEIQLNGGDARV